MFDHLFSMGILQNLPSMVCVRALDPKPDEVILDMCAAPGNKTTHIAALANDEVHLLVLFEFCPLCFLILLFDYILGHHSRYR